MNIPGTNLLNIASRVLRYESITYTPFLGRTLNERGRYVNSYDTAISIKASVQPVPREIYPQMGLDFNKDYITIWTSEDIKDLMRNRASDLVQWRGYNWSIMKESEWFQIDGWDSVIAIKVED